MPSKGDKLKDDIILYRQVQLQYDLEDYTGPQLVSIMNMLNRAQTDLIKKVNRRNTIRVEALNTMTKSVQKELEDKITTTTVGAGKMALPTYNDIMSFDGKVPNFNTVMISPAQMKELVVDTPVGGKLLNEWIENDFQKDLVDELKEEFGAGVLKGEGVRKLAKRIPASMMLLKNHAEGLTRTYIADINNSAALKIYKANSDIIEYEEWSSALEVSRKSGRSTCARCGLLDGERYRLDEFHIRPPLHFF